MKLDCGHLFAGIMGFGLAARWMGWSNIWHSEIDEYCNKIINQHFPESKHYGDIKDINFKEMQSVDLVTGGFPCQPYSQAGERRGKDDERHLWPEMLRAIRALKPRWIVAENVYGIVNWNEGLVFEEVQNQMENEGYEVQPYILPAAATGAPHRRDRVWFVGYSDGIGRNDRKAKGSGESISSIQASGSGSNKDDSDTTGDRLQGRSNEGELRKEGKRTEQRSQNMGEFLRRQWENFPSESPVCGGNDGLPNRVDRIKALGNAIVPQVAFQIFKTIEAYDKQMAIFNS